MTEGVATTKATDERLVRATLAGDISAFGTLVDRYWKMMFAIALNKIADPTEAEDIAQESFLKAHSQLHNLRDPSRFAGWLSKIAVQQCTNLVRSNTRRRAVLGADYRQLGYDSDSDPSPIH